MGRVKAIQIFKFCGRQTESNRTRGYAALRTGLSRWNRLPSRRYRMAGKPAGRHPLRAARLDELKLKLCVAISRPGGRRIPGTLAEDCAASGRRFLRQSFCMSRLKAVTNKLNL